MMDITNNHWCLGCVNGVPPQNHWFPYQNAIVEFFKLDIDQTENDRSRREHRAPLHEEKRLMALSVKNLRTVYR